MDLLTAATRFSNLLNKLIDSGALSLVDCEMTAEEKTAFYAAWVEFEDAIERGGHAVREA